MSSVVQNDNIAARRFGSSSDETLGANFIHLASFNLGCVWGFWHPSIGLGFGLLFRRRDASDEASGANLAHPASCSLGFR
jgi:hypothetical protein